MPTKPTDTTLTDTDESLEDDWTTLGYPPPRPTARPESPCRILSTPPTTALAPPTSADLQGLAVHLRGVAFRLGSPFIALIEHRMEILEVAVAAGANVSDVPERFWVGEMRRVRTSALAYGFVPPREPSSELGRRILRQLPRLTKATLETVAEELGSIADDISPESR
jgi:hypothetical protein